MKSLQHLGGRIAGHPNGLAIDFEPIALRGVNKTNDDFANRKFQAKQPQKQFFIGHRTLVMAHSVGSCVY